jgi:hypothetical protein
MPIQFNHPHLDAAESVFFSRELEFIRARAYDVKFAELKARKFIPLDSEVDNAAEVVTYEQYEMVGMAKILSSYGTDLPRADVKGREFSSRVRPIATSYAYDIQEVRASLRGKKNLPQRKANAARRAAEQEIDRIARAGDAAHGLLGFLNQPNVPFYIIPNGASASPLWANKTPDEVVEDLNGIANSVVDTTKEVEIPDTLILPTDKYNYVASKRMGDGSDVTILKHFLGATPYIKTVESWYALKGAGVGGTDRAVCYRKDPDAVVLVIPQEFEQFPPEQKGLETVIACHARVGGVVFHYPLSAVYADGF